jgi:DNA-binding HxlR family transcriptional regulator
MQKKREVPDCIKKCGVEYAFKRIGGKYKGRILWHLSLKTVLRYGELILPPKCLPKLCVNLKMIN